MEFLDGSNYPNLCDSCRAMISQCVELVMMGPDTDDTEAPIMFVYDHAMFCGGRQCLDTMQEEVEPVGDWAFYALDWDRCAPAFYLVGLNAEVWPVQGGSFDILATELGYNRFEVDTSLVGGYFYNKRGDCLICVPATSNPCGWF